MPFPLMPEISLDRFIIHHRLAGYGFDHIALALAAGAVDALVAGGYRSAALDGGVLKVVESMWDHVSELCTCPRPDGPPAFGGYRPGTSLLMGPEQ